MLIDNITIKVKAESTSDIVRVELYIDGNNVRNFDSHPYNYDDSGLSDGVYTIRAMARDANGKESDRTITIGINVDPNAPTPTP